jgi:hypothetical protein
MTSELTKHVLDSTLQRLRARYDMLDLAGLSATSIVSAPAAPTAVALGQQRPGEPTIGAFLHRPLGAVGQSSVATAHADPSIHRYAPATETPAEHQIQTAYQAPRAGSESEASRKRIVDDAMRELGYVVQGGVDDPRPIGGAGMVSADLSDGFGAAATNISYNATDYDPHASAIVPSERGDIQRNAPQTRQNDGNGAPTSNNKTRADVLPVCGNSAEAEMEGDDRPSDDATFGRPAFAPDEIRRLLASATAAMDSKRRTKLFGIGEKAFNSISRTEGSAAGPSRVYDTYRNVMAAEDRNAAATTNAEPLKSVDAVMREIASLMKHSHTSGDAAVDRRAQHKRSLRPPPPKGATAADDLPVQVYQRIRHVSAQRRTDSSHVPSNRAAGASKRGLLNPSPQGRRRVQSQPRDQIRHLFASDLGDSSRRAGGVKIVQKQW